MDDILDIFGKMPKDIKKIIGNKLRASTEFDQIFDPLYAKVFSLAKGSKDTQYDMQMSPEQNEAMHMFWHTLLFNNQNIQKKGVVNTQYGQGLHAKTFTLLPKSGIDNPLENETTLSGVYNPKTYNPEKISIHTPIGAEGFNPSVSFYLVENKPEIVDMLKKHLSNGLSKHEIIGDDLGKIVVKTTKDGFKNPITTTDTYKHIGAADTTNPLYGTKQRFQVYGSNGDGFKKGIHALLAQRKEKYQRE